MIISSAGACRSNAVYIVLFMFLLSYMLAVQFIHDAAVIVYYEHFLLLVGSKFFGMKN